jgi:hypothetical protein
VILLVCKKGYSPHRFDFRAEINSYRYRMGGQHDGDHHLLNLNCNEAKLAWREACNRIQWNKIQK